MNKAEKELYNKVLALATKAHEGQYRWDKTTPYITHPIAVADKCKTIKQKCIALLHDVLEDTDTTAKEIIAVAGQEYIEPLFALTKNPNEKYSDYIQRIGNQDLDVIIVKINDINHNMSTLDPKKDIKRIEKYELARMYLNLIIKYED